MRKRYVALIVSGLLLHALSASPDTVTVRRDETPVLSPSEVLKQLDLDAETANLGSNGFDFESPCVNVELRRWLRAVKYAQFHAVGAFSSAPFIPPAGLSAVRASMDSWERDENTGGWRRSTTVFWEWPVPDEYQPDALKKKGIRAHCALSEAFDERGSYIERFAAVCHYAKDWTCSNEADLEYFLLHFFDVTKGHLWTAKVPVSSVVPSKPRWREGRRYQPSRFESGGQADVCVTPSGHRVVVGVSSERHAEVVALFIYDGSKGELLRTVLLPGYTAVARGLKGAINRGNNNEFFSAKLSDHPGGAPDVLVFDFDGDLICRLR